MAWYPQLWRFAREWGGGEGGSGGAGSGSEKELRLQPEWSGCQPRSRHGRGAILRPSAVATEPWPRPTVRLAGRSGGAGPVEDADVEVGRGFLFRGRGLPRCRAGLSGSGAELNRFGWSLGDNCVS